MAGKKDNAVVIVITDLTKAQAAQISRSTIQAKAKYAEGGRGSIVMCKTSEVGTKLQSGRRKAIKSK
jgi:hypothetical protein